MSYWGLNMSDWGFSISIPPICCHPSLFVLIQHFILRPPYVRLKFQYIYLQFDIRPSMLLPPQSVFLKFDMSCWGFNIYKSNLIYTPPIRYIYPQFDIYISYSVYVPPIRCQPSLFVIIRWVILRPQYVRSRFQCIYLQFGMCTSNSIHIWGGYGQ